MEKYLPEKLSEDEIGKMVSEVILESGASRPGDIGKVMGQVMAKVSGRADGGLVSEIVKEKLSGSN